MRVVLDRKLLWFVCSLVFNWTVWSVVRVYQPIACILKSIHSKFEIGAYKTHHIPARQLINQSMLPHQTFTDTRGLAVRENKSLVRWVRLWTRSLCASTAAPSLIIKKEKALDKRHGNQWSMAILSTTSLWLDVFAQRMVDKQQPPQDDWLTTSNWSSGLFAIGVIIHLHPLEPCNSTANHLQCKMRLRGKWTNLLFFLSIELCDSAKLYFLSLEKK